MKSKLKSLVVLVAICGTFGFVSNTDVKPKVGEVWLGITYVAARCNCSPESCAAIGAIGVWDAAVS